MTRIILACLLLAATMVQVESFAGSAALRLPSNAASPRRCTQRTVGPQMLLREKVYKAWQKLKDFAAEDDEDSGNKPQVEVLFQPSGKTCTVPAGSCLREAAEKAGAPVIYGCRDGECGTCESELTHEDGSSEYVRICRATVPEMQDSLVVEIQEDACMKKQKSYLGNKFNEVQY
uniref:2Fe-2S ferredoxin-type domain-containing protein n=1 Tax=Hemiselmis andersenii TaxID=464988 RepID=A0A6U2EL99_HEMAN|mmetsp:Transcript_2798/g.6284  ORF Transcript_2798/g.6284 Transcript_2798/m.6284 type:complete len:175 (+) Transcript_2798:128-652(+)